MSQKMLQEIKEGFVSTVTDKVFLGKTIKIAAPVAFQGLLNTSINMLDTLIIGSLGEETIAAVGLANKVFFVYILLVFGICSGSGILAAQFWGSQDIANIKKVLGVAISFSVVASVFFLVPSLFVPHLVMRVFTTSQATIGIGAKYLQVVCLTYPFAALTSVYVSILRATGRVKWPVGITMVALVVDTFLTYVLVFGVMGFPELNVMGAAYGTLASRALECLLIIAYTYFTKTEIAAKLTEMFSFTRAFVGRFLKTAFPVILNEFIWGLGVTMYSLVYGRMGAAAVAVITIAAVIQDLLQVAFQGIANACAVVLGHELGANHLKVAKKYASGYIWLQFLVSIVMGTLCFALRWKFISIFNITEAVANDISKCLILTSVMMPIKTFNWLMVVGVLRSGGDTKYCMFLDTAGVWLIAIPLAVITGLIFKLPIYWVLLFITVEEFFKLILGFRRYKKNIWLKNLTALY